ncbi:MAG: hypothetical protein HY263_07505 [Chloroflexi bacterium]|nr:hypothetical protein [Chloroflexota bacterium]
MTTEVAILNAQAVALAADSAATVDGVGKVYPSANKIFALSSVHPVGIMVWNAGAFMGVPWETIVKLYRQQLGERSFPTVGEYLADFTAFLGSDERLAPDNLADQYFQRLIAGHIQAANGLLREATAQRLETQPPITATELEGIATEVFGAFLERIKAFPLIANDWKASDVRGLHQADLDDAMRETFGDLPLGTAGALAVELTCEAVVRQLQSSAFSGVVVAGFGERDVFPALVERAVDGIVDGRVRCWERGSHFVATEGPGIVPFAQRDMIQVFVEGVNPAYQEAIEAMVRQLIDGYPTALMGATTDMPAGVQASLAAAHQALGQEYLKQALKVLTEWRGTQFVQELMEVVATLPKEALADLAEALVSLTSLRRRMSRGQETVGGPIDVAVISKGDGLIWLRRKHYFDPNLNPQYMSNRYRRAH